jgi:non-lysosomal glucosylceramidase
MAGYGVFLAACGYEYHGPKGHLGFAPRLSPDDFRAPFTAAEGWGTFTQKREGKTQKQTVALRWGRLRVKTLAFELPADAKAARVGVRVAGKALDVEFTQEGRRVTVALPADTEVKEGQAVEVEVGT